MNPVWYDASADRTCKPYWLGEVAALYNAYEPIAQLRIRGD